MTEYNYSLLPKAVKDILSIRTWYDEQSYLAGNAFLDEFELYAARISMQPDRYSAITPAIRRCIMKRFPYKIFYAIDENTVIILRVRHNKQKQLKRFK